MSRPPRRLSAPAPGAPAARLVLTFTGLDWDAAAIAALLGRVPGLVVVAHEASTCPTYRDFSAEDLQETLEQDFGWPAGFDGGDAGDGASTLTVTMAGAPKTLAKLAARAAAAHEAGTWVVCERPAEGG